MSDADFYRLALELSSAAIQEFGWHASQYPEHSAERAAYTILESKANELFHAAWERVMKRD